MPKLIITCGVSGSGKSTYGAELARVGFCEINRDHYRFSMFCDGKQDWSLYKFTKDREKIVTELCDSQWDGCVSMGWDVIVSNTNLNQKDHTYWKTKAEEAGYEFEVKYFDITLTEALRRDSRH